MMNQQSTPIFDGLLHYRKSQVYSFHVPGHKDGLIFPERAARYFRPLLTLDATEVANLDDLYRPEGIIRDGEALLSDYYGSHASFFLVNGSTIGNLIMVLSACAAGEVVFVQRDSHKSIFNALRLAGVHPVFLAPTVDKDSGLAAGIHPQAWTAAVRRYPRARALVLTYPNYYGMAAANTRDLIEKAHARGMIVLVDEAHGAHFKLGAPVPPSALDMGADLVVHSAHKMLPAMTMGAYLHMNSGRVSKERVEEVRASLQSSSPSYPIMASLDLARYMLAQIDTACLDRMISLRDTFVRRLDGIAGVSVLEAVADHYLLDPFKVTLEAETEENGFEWQRRLIAAGVFPELADPRHVLFTLGLTDQMDYERAIDLIRTSLTGLHLSRGEHAVISGSFPLYSELARPYDDLRTMKKKLADLDRTVGQIAAEHVIPYPPGVPIIIQGERITVEAVDLIRNWRHAGAVFQNEKVNQGKIMIYQPGVS